MIKAIEPEDGVKPTEDEKVELSDEDLEGVSGGFNFHQWKRNPTQVPMSQPFEQPDQE